MLLSDSAADVLAQPFVTWAGLSTPPDLDPTALAEFNAFYSKTHIPEILRHNPGFVAAARFELTWSDPRGLAGPTWLAMYGVQDEAAARAYILQSQLPREQRPPQTPGPPAWSAARREWRLLWRRTGSVTALPDPAPTLYLEGVNLPQGDEESFMDVDPSAPPALSSPAPAVRFELYHPFETPASAAAQLVTAYGLGAASPADVATRLQTARDTARGRRQPQILWRLLYRRLDA